MKSLSLFDQVGLNSVQVDALPSSIREKIFKGYSDVLNAPCMVQIEPALDKIQFAAKTAANGSIRVSYDGVNYVEAGSLKEFPKLLTAMREAYDAARIQFPEAFREAKPIGPMRVYPLAGGSRFGEARAIGVDVNSMFRNSFSAAKICAPFIALSGLAAGGVGLWTGAEIAIKENENYSRASSLGDEEGKTQAMLGAAGGVLYEMASCGQLGAFFPSALDLLPGSSTSTAATNISTGYGYLANGSTILMSFALAASAIHEWQYVSEFREGLHRILERDASSEKKAIETLEFFQQQIGLTAKDWGDLADKGLDQNREAIHQKLMEKHDRFVRRVGADVATRVAKESIGLLAALKEGDPEALKNTKDLIELADRESFKKRVKEITFLIISILMISAVIISSIYVDSSTPSILFAINAACWLSIDSSWANELIGGGFHSLLKRSEADIWSF
jgi:hypothetical protein